MLCEICSEKEAVVHFKHVADSEVRELNICEACAVKNGLSIQPPDLLTDFLMGKTSKPVFASKAAEPKQERVCLACGMQEKDFNKISRLGCDECYTVFDKDVEHIVCNMQHGASHVGRIPASFVESESGMSRLKAMLEEAVSRQDFEEAARLRDIIENSMPEQGGSGSK